MSPDEFSFNYNTNYLCLLTLWPWPMSGIVACLVQTLSFCFHESSLWAESFLPSYSRMSSGGLNLVP